MTKARGDIPLPLSSRTLGDPDEANECRLYTVVEVAALCGVGPTKVREWIDSGELKRIRWAGPAGGRPKDRVMHTTLLAWLKAQED